MARHTQSIEAKVLSRINAAGSDAVFTARHFLDLGSRDAIDQALSRHCRAGTLRKVARGLYEVPRTHPKLGRLAASSDAIAEALKGRDAIRLQPAGAYAANILGLSDQVPVKLVFLTDGPTRRVKVGNREITLKRTTPRNMATAGRTSGIVIQALRWLGHRHVDEKVISRLRRNLKPEDRATLVKDAHLAPAWIGAIFHRLAAEGK